MSELCKLIWYAFAGPFSSRAALVAEMLVLRHQLNVLRRKSPSRMAFSGLDRAVFAGLYALAILNALKIVKPGTVVRWHRAGFLAYWRWKSRPRVGRPTIPSEICQLIREMSVANPLLQSTDQGQALFRLSTTSNVERIPRGWNKVHKRGCRHPQSRTSPP